MEEEELNELLKTLNKEVADKLKAAVDAFKEEFKGEQVTKVAEAIQTALKAVVGETKEGEKVMTVKALEEALVKQGDLLKKYQNGGVINTVKMQIKTFFKENAEKIAEIKAAGTGHIELTVKAPEDITTGSGINTTPPAITGSQQAPLSTISLREMNIVGLTTNLNTSLAAYPYTETVPKDGDYAFLDEGEVKPQIDFKWETNYAKPVKIAAWERLTDEAVQDVEGLESIANDYLRKKHNLKKNKGILAGDGVSPNPKGATTYGRVFAAGSMALQVEDTNFMDVVNACITDISTTHNYQDEMPYMANLVMVNPVDFFLQLVSAKDKNGLPLYPQASLFNQVMIGSTLIIPEEEIPAGKVFVADMSKYNTTNYIDYTVKVGWVNDDFIKNQFVILGESRFHAFVKKLDEQAFIYDDIATIKTAITKVQL